MSKNDLISLFIENNDKLSNSITELANQKANASETLKRMESQQAVSKSANDSAMLKNSATGETMLEKRTIFKARIH